ncbi:8996_t:CDS:2 [Gigaspora margarita]|uniref:8996_t:CDS:1 n=1 Tax=Gigaspora margarita TaxID=4874 RepID=A0ABN7VQX7_GIGMA|nr:8996_t:CDS:2 [Gigaspora margarita]
MLSIFISFCFIKTITGSDKYVSGSALYRIKDNKESFREIIYKGFTGSSETLIDNFENNSIVLMIGRYVYDKNTKYVTLIQATPISYFSDDTSITSEDLPYSFLLMIYSAPAVTNSYQSNDELGRYSFMLFSESQTLSSSNKGKEKPHDNLDNQLDLIEEKYAKMDAQSSKK